jgi:hypothetical protein
MEAFPGAIITEVRDLAQSAPKAEDAADIPNIDLPDSDLPDDDFGDPGEAAEQTLENGDAP